MESRGMMNLSVLSFTEEGALDELTALSKDKRMVFIIDHKWSESKVYLILCGSSMSFVESQELGMISLTDLYK